MKQNLTLDSRLALKLNPTLALVGFPCVSKCGTDRRSLISALSQPVSVFLISRDALCKLGMRVRSILSFFTLPSDHFLFGSRTPQYGPRSPLPFHLPSVLHRILFTPDGWRLVPMAAVWLSTYCIVQQSLQRLIGVQTSACTSVLHRSLHPLLLWAADPPCSCPKRMPHRGLCRAGPLVSMVAVAGLQQHLRWHCST